MKLRCTNNSIRLRLRRSEIQELQHQGSISEGVDIPGSQPFSYQLELAEQKQTSVSFKEGRLCVRLPLEQASVWIESNQVGIGQSIPLSAGEQLHLLIEKDFPCKTRPDENKADFFTELAPDDESC